MKKTGIKFTANGGAIIKSIEKDKKELKQAMNLEKQLMEAIKSNDIKRALEIQEKLHRKGY